MVGLTAISSDVALRKLKAKRWKQVQRWNYLLAALAAIHAVLYGAFWRLTSPYTVALIASVVFVVVGQAVGVRLWRRRKQLAQVESQGDAGRQLEPRRGRVKNYLACGALRPGLWESG